MGVIGADRMGVIGALASGGGNPAGVAGANGFIPGVEGGGPEGVAGIPSERLVVQGLPGAPRPAGVAGTPTPAGVTGTIRRCDGASPTLRSAGVAGMSPVGVDMPCLRAITAGEPGIAASGVL